MSQSYCAIHYNWIQYLTYNFKDGGNIGKFSFNIYITLHQLLYFLLKHHNFGDNVFHGSGLDNLGYILWY